MDTITWFEESGSTCIFGTDTTRSYLKEEVVSILDVNNGTTNYILERFFRKDLSEPWEIQDVWNIVKYDSKVERVEENLRFIKMVFPVAEGSQWNGNAFINADTSVAFAGSLVAIYQFWDSNYRYSRVDESEQIGSFNLDSVVTIIQSDTQLSDVINYRFSTEKYARNVGLVYKEMRIIESQCCGPQDSMSLSICQALDWEERAEKGFKLVQKVIDFN